MAPPGRENPPSCAPSTATSPSAAAPSGWTARRFPPSGERLCGSCGASFHIVANPPKHDGVCDLCGAPLTVRKDDAPETVKNRLKVFHAETEPLKDFYKKLGNLKLVEGNQPIEYATRDILAALGE